MSVSVEISNLALGDIRAPAITDLDEDSIEAATCKTYYPHCLALLLDDYTWEFAKRVASLARLSTNERAQEWAYAYALPSDTSRALRLMPGSSLVSDATLWRDPMNAPLPAWWLSFIVENDVLYCNVADAVLEYSSNEADEARFPAIFKEALRKLLAANICIPIRNEPQLADGLFRQAEMARQAAIASDMNRAPRNEMTDDIAWARR